MRYRITAMCNSKKCKGLEIISLKNKVRKVSTAEIEYVIKNIVCPRCRMWAEIKKIEEIKA
jgi:hypothetical protein